MHSPNLINGSVPPPDEPAPEPGFPIARQKFLADESFARTPSLDVAVVHSIVIISVAL